nr:hypothetical protein [Sinorhizobium sp. BJ1]
MGCVVRCNRFEQYWDCPCHGSHTDEPLQGPASSRC